MIDFTEIIDPLEKPVDIKEVELGKNIPKTEKPVTPTQIKDLPNVESFSCGAVHIDSNGIWIGDTFETASFKITQKGESNINTTIDPKDILKTAYPIGKIYISTVSTNPRSTLGFGTWISFGSGKMLVGVDVTDSNFDTVEKIGGTSTLTIATTNLPSHAHTVDPPSTNTGTESATHTHGITQVSGVFGSSGVWEYSPGSSASHFSSGTESATHYHTIDIAQFNSGSVGSGTALASMNPYVTVYFFKRTA